MSIVNPSVSSSVVAEPVEATTIGSGALPDSTTVDAAMGGEPVGRSVSASLSSRWGRCHRHRPLRPVDHPDVRAARLLGAARG